MRYLSVVWCKASKKKHKRWEGDAVLITRGRTATLKDMEGKDIGKGEINVMEVFLFYVFYKFIMFMSDWRRGGVIFFFFYIFYIFSLLSSM